jgi:hypothetical protein
MQARHDRCTWLEEDVELLQVLRGRLGLPEWAIGALLGRTDSSVLRACFSRGIRKPEGLRGVYPDRRVERRRARA